MKYYAPILIALLTSKVLLGQNLVPNHSFEEYTACPSKISDLNSSSGWSKPTLATTDYYNQCSDDFSSNPLLNIVGSQNPQDGNAFIGIITYQKNALGYTELAQIRLTEPLQRRKYYKISYYVSLAEVSYYGNPFIGALFATDSIEAKGLGIPYNQMSGKVTILNQKPVVDCENWILVKGTYQAEGNEKFLIIGNYIGTPPKSALPEVNMNHVVKERLVYYYIDNVEVIEAEGKRDEDFEHRKNDSSSIAEIPNRLLFSQEDKLFLNNETRLIKLKDLKKEIRNNPSFETDILNLDYLADYLYRNKSSTLEIVLLSKNDPNSDGYNFQYERLQSLKKTLSKKTHDNQVSFRIESSSNTEDGRLYIEIK